MSAQHKHYHDGDMNAKDLVETHFSHGQVDIVEESTGFPMMVMHKRVSKGLLKGSKLLDFSLGSSVYQLFPLCNIYKEMYVLELTDSHIDHMKLWLDKDEKATDWSFAAKRVCQLDGNRKDWRELEDQARQAVKSVLKWENHETNPIDPKLVPEVDCVISMYILSVCKTKEELQNTLKNLVSPLKIGGHLIWFLPLNMSYYMVGQHRFFVQPINEKTFQEFVINAGFVIEESGLMKNAEKSDLRDYSHVGYVVARKV
ncbi:indolethylamine N-methyltransferase-like [Hyperolius riggenbachi]|uniref:indolethylamine N-methyltransferase-like n=1 Tax=Hyperolius riggenbachi TaxID=752182 RepID=UPI0035A26277